MAQAKTTEQSEFCTVCGGEVVSFVQQPTMWHFTLTSTGPGPKTTMIDETVCIGCATDLIKYRAEVMAHKHDAAIDSVSKLPKSE